MRFFRIYVLLSCLLTSWEAQALELLFHVSALPPYVKDDPRRGLVPEIVTRAFATQGIQCRFIRSNNKRMETEVEAGTADAGFAGIPVNNAKIFFSDPVIEFENVAVTLSDKHLQINSLSDLSDKKIVAFSNAQKVLGPEFTMAVKNHRSYSEVGDQASQVPMLDAGRGMLSCWIYGLSCILRGYCMAKQRQRTVIRYIIYLNRLHACLVSTKVNIAITSIKD
jgi:polar amino acid transport system substrate-binding protein